MGIMDYFRPKPKKPTAKPELKLITSPTITRRVWERPPLDLLDALAPDPIERDTIYQADLIEQTLASFKTDVEIENVAIGPNVTQFHLVPGPGVTIAQIQARRQDLARVLRSGTVRIVGAQVGTSAIMLEVPNEVNDTVTIGSLFHSWHYNQLKQTLAIAVGRNIDNTPLFIDLATSPHMLVAGATGSGKSVFLNALLVSLLVQYSPDEVELVIIDPKRVEFPIFNHVPHMRTPVIIDPVLALQTLSNLVATMDDRYRKLFLNGVRNLDEYNRAHPDTPMPRIVVLIDEYADLVMRAPKEVEHNVIRLAQLARAVGIHLVIATQRPTANVITGLIKSNIPSRIAFRTVSSIDSRVILDDLGSENLIGSGDGLMIHPSQRGMTRFQGAWVTNQEIADVIQYWIEVKEGYYP